VGLGQLEMFKLLTGNEKIQLNIGGGSEKKGLVANDID
jgi:hypothetical protein